jgi:uncharacterized protein (TIGR02266 family)
MTEVDANLVVETPEALVDRYYPNGTLGGLSVDGRLPAALGTRMLLTVKVKKPVREFTVRGVLAWVRHSTTRQVGSFGVDFTPDDDATRVRLLAFARREVDADAVRVEKRVQVELPVRLVHAGHTRREFLADLSTRGAFVRTWNPLAVGEQVQLAVRPPGALAVLLPRSLELDGRVAWARTTGDHPGMGIEFTVDDAARARVEKLLARLA